MHTGLVKIGLIGCGYWGNNLARNIFKSDKAELTAVFDMRPEAAEAFGRQYPDSSVAEDLNTLLQDTTLDALALATPASTHFDLAREAIRHGKHVLVEKPASQTSAEISELHQLARDTGKVFMVDHTYLYSGPIACIKELLDQEELGSINYVQSIRINLGKVQPDINVVWDLATHDISIINHLLGKTPISVQVSSASHLPNGRENMAFLSLYYPNNAIAHIHVSWSSPVKRREMLVGGDRKMLVYNDLVTTEKVALYDSGHDVVHQQDGIEVSYRNGEACHPDYDVSEPLQNVINSFANAILKGSQAPSKMPFDIGVIKVLEAAQQSIDSGGIKINLD